MVVYTTWRLIKGDKEQMEEKAALLNEALRETRHLHTDELAWIRTEDHVLEKQEKTFPKKPKVNTLTSGALLTFTDGGFHFVL